MDETTDRRNLITITEVRQHYGAAAERAGALTESSPCCAGSVVDEDARGLYPADDTADIPSGAVAASMACGNPVAVADLTEGDVVVDLGCGAGLDALLAARRVGPHGHVIGVDMTPQMLDLARRHAERAGADNVEFREGTIEDLPVTDATVDWVVSNCVINLSVDKPAVMREMHRVLRPGGRVGVADIVATDGLTPDERAERGTWAGCIAGALSYAEMRSALSDAGFVDITLTPTHEVVPGMDSVLVRARKP